MVVGFCFLLPDLMDKPAWVLGVISDGRYIGHTLLNVFLVAVAFSMVKRSYGLLALCGGIAHLMTDLGGTPLFYPFKRYDFSPNDFHHIVTLTNVIETLMQMVLVVLVVLLLLAVLQGLVLLFRRRYGTTLDGSKDIMGISEVNSKNDRASAHGDYLCWTARIASTLLSLFAVTYVLFTRVKYDSAWTTIPAAVCVFALSITPPIVAWWSHRFGGALAIVVCVAYVEYASRLANRSTFVHVLLPFLAVWTAAVILHLVLSWKERAKEVAAV